MEKVPLVILQMLLIMVNGFKILLTEKPDVLISTGSEIAIPIFYIAKILNKKLIFVESLCRIDDLSGTGKMMMPISDVFLVQWEDLARKYEKARYRGSILPRKINSAKKMENGFIFVTVGSAPFPRLVKEMDKISKTLEEKVIMQIGRTNYKPKNAEYFDFTTDYEKIRELNRKAKVVISHAGVGSIINALEEGTPIILVTRLKKYREVIDDHQLEIAKVLKEQGLAEVAYDLNNIPTLLKLLNNKPMQKDRYAEDGRNHLVMFLKTLLEKKELIG